MVAGERERLVFQGADACVVQTSNSGHQLHQINDQPCLIHCTSSLWLRVVWDSNSGHQLLLPPANCCPVFASRTTHCEGPPGTSLSYISLGVFV